MDSKVFDGIRTRLWLAQIRSLTGIQATHALAERFDPGSIWVDEGRIPHQSKWYRFEHAKAVPSRRLAARVRAAVPGQTFDIHHPTWSLLRSPNPSLKTLERLTKRMPTSWQQTLKCLKAADFSFRRVTLEMVDMHGLQNMGYLDSFLLLELARRHALEYDVSKVESLTFVILALPLVYIQDPVWTLQDRTTKEQMLTHISEFLGLSDAFGGSICFPPVRMVQAMAMQQALKDRYLAKHRRGLNSDARVIRFLAKSLEGTEDGRYATATSAYFKEGPLAYRARLLMFGADPYAQSRWEWAWNWLETGPEFSHLWSGWST